MKKIIILNSIIVVLFLSGCAQQGNNNPTGVIGGPGNFGDTGGSIVGTWLNEEIDEDRETYKTLDYRIFNDDGSLYFEYFQYYWDENDGEWILYSWGDIDGIYSVEENLLTYTYSNGNEYTRMYEINSNELWIYYDDYFIVFTRVYGTRDNTEMSTITPKSIQNINSHSFK